MWMTVGNERWVKSSSHILDGGRLVGALLGKSLGFGKFTLTSVFSND